MHDAHLVRANNFLIEKVVAVHAAAANRAAHSCTCRLQGYSLMHLLPTMLQSMPRLLIRLLLTRMLAHSAMCGPPTRLLLTWLLPTQLVTHRGAAHIAARIAARIATHTAIQTAVQTAAHRVAPIISESDTRQIAGIIRKKA